MKSAVGVALSEIAITGTWKHAATTGRPGWILRLTSNGDVRSRFNPGNHPEMRTLYLAFDESTARFEKRAVFGDPLGPPSAFIPGPTFPTTAVIDVAVDLRSVVDLTDVAAHGFLETSAQELTGDWMGYEERGRTGPSVVLSAPTGVAPTQLLGLELFDRPEIEGITYISAKVPVTCCLVVFTHKLNRPGCLSWDDPNTGKRESYP